jgi:hypothetical protein
LDPIQLIDLAFSQVLPLIITLSVDRNLSSADRPNTAYPRLRIRFSPFTMHPAYLISRRLKRN